jgi:hypothetical protein
MRKRKHGMVLSVSTFCILCHREDQKIREARRYKKKLAYNRLWCKRNREKVNFYKRKDYSKMKSKKESNDVGAVEWYKTTSNDGFSQMTYTPLKVFGGW